MNRITVSTIISAAVEVTGIAKEILLSKSRQRDHVRARQMAMYVAREFAGRSYPDIGRRLGNRDHTTALHGYRKVRRLLDESQFICADVQRIAALSRELAQRPVEQPDVLVEMTGGPEKPDARFKAAQEHVAKRATKLRKVDPIRFPDREPAENVSLPPHRPRASTSSNHWVGGWPSEDFSQPRANVGPGNAIGENVA